MSQLLHLLKHDFVLLQRNRIIILSLAVTAVYTAVFRLLASYGEVEKFLILVIFNDPALIGFLFVGVIVLFENNENTIQALAVSPVKVRNYILSKSLALTSISVVCCYAMAIACFGSGFHVFHYGMAAILGTLMFSFLGFVIVAGQTSFNRYILRAIGVIILLAVPFLGYFDIVSRHWFILFPTQPAIDLFSLSLAGEFDPLHMAAAYAGAAAWCFITYKWASKRIVKSFRK